MNFVSLFAGIGGIDLGLERAGMTCVAQVERDPFCRAVLAKHWRNVPRFNDVRTFGRASIYGAVQLICGGFPCQDISVAGAGAALEGERSGLWWEFDRIIGEFEPEWVLAENVPALRNRGADDVLSSLEARNYTTWPIVVGAEHVGFPHKRHRVWIVAHLDVAACDRQLRNPSRKSADRSEVQIQAEPYPAGRGDVGQPVQPPALADTERGARSERWARSQRLLIDRAQGRRDESEHRPFGCGEALAVATGARLQESGSSDAGQVAAVEASSGPTCLPARPGEPQHGWEAPRLIELPVGGAVDGVPARLVRAANRHALRAFGNSVVPQVVELIGQQIFKAHAVLHPATVEG